MCVPLERLEDLGFRVELAALDEGDERVEQLPRQGEPGGGGDLEWKIASLHSGERRREIVALLS